MLTQLMKLNDLGSRGGTGATAPTTQATAPREAGEPMMAIVSIMSQQVNAAAERSVAVAVN